MKNGVLRGDGGAGAPGGIRTRDHLLRRPDISSAGPHTNWLEKFITSRLAERGLTTQGEQWVRQTLGKFLRRYPEPLYLSREDIEGFLGDLNGPWNRHSHFRAIRAFYNWLEGQELITVSPCHRMKAPRLPSVVLDHPSLPQIRQLISAAPTVRDKAIVSLFADTGMRLSELCQITPDQIQWEVRSIRIYGKARKERLVKFGSQTHAYLAEHLSTFQPTGNMWGIGTDGVVMLLKRLTANTGIKANPHAFRRFFAIELRRRGVDSQTIQYLGGWESLAMVERYSKAAKAEIALAEYVPLTDE